MLIGNLNELCACVWFYCIISCFSCKDFQILRCKYFLAVQYLHFICQKYFFWVLIEVTSGMDWSRKSGDSVYSSEFLAYTSRVPVDICLCVLWSSFLFRLQLIFLVMLLGIVWAAVKLGIFPYVFSHCRGWREVGSGCSGWELVSCSAPPSVNVT